jgi:hypothetical protein
MEYAKYLMTGNINIEDLQFYFLLATISWACDFDINKEYNPTARLNQTHIIVTVSLQQGVKKKGNRTEIVRHALETIGK